MAEHDLEHSELAWARQAARAILSQSVDTADLSIVLDLVAVIAGHKPVALIQSADDLEVVSRLPRPVLASHAVETHPYWLVPEETTGLPDWYARAMGRLRAMTTVHIFASAAGMPFVPPSSVAAEAALLAYPLCCVAEFYRRRRLHHLVAAKRIRHFAGPDIAKATAYVMSEVMLAPSSAAERAAHAAAINYVLAPYTGVAMCRVCVADVSSPARCLSNAYRAFAQAAGIEDLLSPGAGILSSGN